MAMLHEAFRIALMTLALAFRRFALFNGICLLIIKLMDMFIKICHVNDIHYGMVDSIV